jgi:hypothetical protein
MTRKAPELSTQNTPPARSSERGAALVTSILILGMLGAIAITVLAVVSKEAKIAGSDLKRTQTFYAAAAGIEKMTTDFSGLFQVTSRPSAGQLIAIQNAWPQELQAEGYTFDQLIGLDDTALNSMRATQGITNGGYPRVTIPSGEFNGLSASVAPYVLSSQATAADGTQVALTRQMNNYLIPIFQFGMFSNDDIELHPGPPFSFNGRVHANGNIYVNGNVSFLSKVTTANELVYDVLRNGVPRTGATVSVQVGAVRVPLTMGSMFGGPNIVGSTTGQRGFFPGSPDGTINGAWDSTSVGPASVGVANQFAGQVQTRTTGGSPLVLPMQLTGASTREIIKRRTPSDPQVVRDSRYHSKAQIRILIDDENPAAADTSGIPAGQGVPLTAFDPIPLPNVPVAAGGGRALWRIKDDLTYLDTAATCVLQEQGGAPGQALTVRGVKATSQAVSLNGTATNIPGGAGLSGRILIQIVDGTGNVIDVTQQILSMGVTVGEPNAIVTLQRPLWAAFTQGSRDASAAQNIAPDGTPYFNCLTDIVGKTYIAADGQLQTAPGPAQDGLYGYLTGLVDDIAAGQALRADTPPTLNIADWGTPNWSNNNEWNAMVPINVYNVREGCIDSVNCDAVYERGITNVVELNMRNLARWLDGVYDNNLLAGSPAVSGNIANPVGFTVYVSDRRGDKVNPTTDFAGVVVDSSNGMVDNEDIYGANGLLDPGEDVQNTGALVKDTTELPDPAVLGGIYGADLTMRALTVAAWSNTNNYFRHSVRLFNGEDLQLAGGANQLSATQGITVATENMLYIWGNYNTTGINLAPPLGTASLNEPAAPFRYLGDQVPASLVSDAFFPLSKTWSDSCSAMFPGNLGNRRADLNLPGDTAETAVRAGIISGNNLGALAGAPDAGNGVESRLNGGMHNFPRFLEGWGARWNFAGSLIPLYRSTQAVGPYNSSSTIYSPPIRNWAFDSTFLDPNKLPPSTPQFQYVQPTAFRQLL